MANEQNAKFLTYKGLPLVRSGNTLYYGNQGDPYTAMIQIISTKQAGEMNIANRVIVLLLNNDPNIDPKDKIAQRAEKYSLYQAIDLASAWLTKSFKKTQQ